MRYCRKASICREPEEFSKAWPAPCICGLQLLVLTFSFSTLETLIFVAEDIILRKRSQHFVFHPAPAKFQLFCRSDFPTRGSEGHAAHSTSWSFLAGAWGGRAGDGHQDMERRHRSVGWRAGQWWKPSSRYGLERNRHQPLGPAATHLSYPPRYPRQRRHPGDYLNNGMELPGVRGLADLTHSRGQTAFLY